jgi:hypothetical protein
MLKEITNPRQNINEKRRIFTNSYFDLYVWFEDNKISGFQLCYDKGNFERALTWTEQNGFSHMKVDDGESPDAAYKMKPMLVIDGIFDNKAIADRFINDCGAIDLAIAEFVRDKIERFS